ncbi:hypothetical protein [Escherichia coli]
MAPSSSSKLTRIAVQ